MKLSITDQATARKRRAEQYEANMAVEGLHLSDEAKQFSHQLDAEGVVGEDALDRVEERLRLKGFIPSTAEALAAE